MEGGTLLDRTCMVFQSVCVCCACDHSGRLDAPSMCFVCVLRAGSQVFALIVLFLCVIMHNMWSGKNLQLLCILPFGMLCLSSISMFVKIMLAVCMLVVGIIIISLFSHMVIHYVKHIKHVLKWYSSNVNKIMKKNNHL